MSKKIGILFVILGSTDIVALAVLLVWTSIQTHHGPVPGQGLLVVFLVPPALLLIALGIVIGVRQLPDRGYSARTRDIVILSIGGAVGASVVLWLLIVLIA